MPKTMGFNDEPPMGKDVKDTSMLSPGAREKNATGTNSQKRHTTTHPKFGKLGAKGHPD